MTNVSPKRLLILASTARKTNDDIAPAIDRYLGPSFFLVRRHLRRTGTRSLVIWILSPRYGLMDSKRATVNYENAMTPARAEELQDKIHRQFVYLVNDAFPLTAPWSTCVHMPANYVDVIAPHIALIRKSSLLPLTVTAGTAARRSQVLRGWLQMTWLGPVAEGWG